MKQRIAIALAIIAIHALFFLALSTQFGWKMPVNIYWVTL